MSYAHKTFVSLAAMANHMQSEGVSGSAILHSGYNATLGVHELVYDDEGLVKRKTLDWTLDAWDGAAARPLKVREGAGYVRVWSYSVSAAGAGGGCTERTAYLCEDGRAITAAKVTGTTTAVADQINEVLDVPRPMLANADGEIDIWVVPDVGTTAEYLEMDVEAL